MKHPQDPNITGLIFFASNSEELQHSARQYGISQELLEHATLVTPGCDMCAALSLPEGTAWHRVIDWAPDMVRQNNQLWARFGQPVSACKAFNSLKLISQALELA